LSIDDVTLKNCALPPPISVCQPGELKCLRGNCVSITRICDFVDDCGDLTDELQPVCSQYRKCDFDKSFCDWKNQPSQTLNWERITGVSPIQKTGPERDHTTGFDTGSYLFLAPPTSIQDYFKPSSLLSRNFIKSASQNCEFIFYYYMFGVNIGTLNVYVRISEGNQKLIWSKTGNQGSFWVRNVLTLDATSGTNNASVPFQVVIEGTPRSDPKSSFAIDDTAFSPGCLAYNLSLPTYPTTSTVVTTPNPCGQNFTCSSSPLVCISQSQVCDFTVNCPDGSDELNCGPCDFETDMCSWEDDSMDAFFGKIH
jgi:hypothetical protein